MPRSDSQFDLHVWDGKRPMGWPMIVPRSCSQEMHAQGWGHDEVEKYLMRKTAYAQRRIRRSLKEAIKRNDDEGLPPVVVELSRRASSAMESIDDSILVDSNLEGPRPRRRLNTRHSNIERSLPPDRVSWSRVPFLFPSNELVAM